MLAIFALLALAVLLPPVLRLLRAILVLHLWTIVLFLPAGFLLRLGNRDMGVYFGVTAAWGALLAGWRIRRRWTARRAERRAHHAPARPRLRRPYRERLA